MNFYATRTAYYAKAENSVEFSALADATIESRQYTEGFIPRYGAHPLRKAIMDLIEDPVSEMLIQRRLTSKQPSDRIIRT